MKEDKFFDLSSDNDEDFEYQVSTSDMKMTVSGADFLFGEQLKHRTH